MVHPPVQITMALKACTAQPVKQADTCRSGPSLSKRGARVKLASHANTSVGPHIDTTDLHRFIGIMASRGGSARPGDLPEHLVGLE
jgi:hypothetical protein